MSQVGLKDRRYAVMCEMARDPFFMARTFFPGMMEWRTPDFHREIMGDYINPDLRKVVVEAPRGYAKSSLTCGVFAVHHAFFSDLYEYLHGYTREWKVTNKVIVISSETQKLAKRHLAGIKNCIEYNEYFRMLFGYLGEQVALRWTQDEIQLSWQGATITIIAMGMRQPIRGMKEAHTRITCFIGDDIESEENTKTSERMEANFEWFNNAVNHALAPGGKVIIIGTPIHQNCLLRRVRKSEAWTHLHYSAIINYGDPENERPLWPEKESLEELRAQLREAEEFGKASGFFQEKLCIIKGDASSPFHQQDARYWKGEYVEQGGAAFIKITHKSLLDEDLVELATPKYVPVVVFMGVDLAASVQKYADRTVILAVAVTEDDDWYVLPYYAGRLKPLAVADQVVHEYKKYKPQKVRVETVAYQEMMKDYLSEHAEVWMPIVGEKPRNQRSARLERMQPWWAGGKVYLPWDQRDLILQEAIMYPRGEHDDTLDALDLATKTRWQPTHTVPPGLGGREPRRVVEQEEQYYEDWMIA